MNYSSEELNRLAWAIDADGLLRHQAEAAQVVDQARRVGVSTPMLDVLADETVPAPVRERAFGKVVNAIVHATPSPAEWALAN